MMAKYGEVATRAVGLLLWEPDTSPADAWESAAARVFPDSPSSREKSCPRSAFLGLCEDGIVTGVSPGAYSRSVLNKGKLQHQIRSSAARPRAELH
jgi:hypothetical protein